MSTLRPTSMSTFERIVELINKVRPVVRVDAVEAGVSKVAITVWMFPDDRGATYYALFEAAIEKERPMGVTWLLHTKETTEEQVAHLLLTADED